LPEVYDIMMKIGITETVIGVPGQISSFMKGLHGETIALEGSMNRLTRGVRDFGLRRHDCHRRWHRNCSTSCPGLPTRPTFCAER
jgi:hypothetical protein